MQHIKKNNGGSQRRIGLKEKPDCPVITAPFNPLESIYRQDYGSPNRVKLESFRKGAWYEHKRNIPQPDEIFMVHHINRKEIKRVPTPIMYWDRHPTEKEIHEILGGDFSTEYQDNFSAGNKQQIPKTILPRTDKPGKKIPHPLMTEFRDQYRLPCLIKDFMIDTSRHGSNATRNIPTRGIVPTMTYAHIKNQENRKNPTTYQEYYGNDYDGLASFLKSVDIESLNRELQNSDPNERKALRRFLECVTAKCVTQPRKSKIC
ncbi:testis-expressed protein 26-like [Pristis pectinata]|uniref:testis-expressed protein 26-like n=1 Tax=Pristis pectinata TaxID=685728 RepID=UPI00223CC6F1|nr:testis-expressed protein 26-like [Pristis pectinata]